MMTQIGRRMFTIGLAFFAILSLTLGLQSHTAQATPAKPAAAVSAAHSAAYKASSAFSRAWSKKGGWYSYGANGPRSYDCSGLTYYAYSHHIPRIAGDQRSSSKTYHISRWKAVKGDLAFNGYGHVEMVYDFNKSRTQMRTYGAHHTGTRISVTSWHKIWHIERVR